MRAWQFWFCSEPLPVLPPISWRKWNPRFEIRNAALVYFEAWECCRRGGSHAWSYPCIFWSKSVRGLPLKRTICKKNSSVVLSLNGFQTLYFSGKKGFLGVMLPELLSLQLKKDLLIQLVLLWGYWVNNPFVSCGIFIPHTAGEQVAISSFPPNVGWPSSFVLTSQRFVSNRGNALTGCHCVVESQTDIFRNPLSRGKYLDNKIIPFLAGLSPKPGSPSYLREVGWVCLNCIGPRKGILAVILLHDPSCWHLGLPDW